MINLRFSATKERNHLYIFLLPPSYICLSVRHSLRRLNTKFKTSPVFQNTRNYTVIHLKCIFDSSFSLARKPRMLAKFHFIYDIYWSQSMEIIFLIGKSYVFYLNNYCNLLKKIYKKYFEILYKQEKESKQESGN